MRWSKFKDFAPAEMFKVVKEDVFPFIKKMGGENFAKYVKDAVFMIPSSGLFASAVDMIGKLEMQESFEKLLPTCLAPVTRSTLNLFSVSIIVFLICL